jgi:hypothetical protein
MHNTTRKWVRRGLVALVLGGSQGAVAQSPARSAEDALGMAQRRPVGKATSADFLVGTQWVLNDTGALVRMERVAVVLDIDDARQIVRLVVAPEDPGSKTARRVATFAIASIKRDGPLVSLTAVADDDDNVAHTLQITARGGKARTHELWTTAEGKVVRSVHSVASRVTRLEVDQSLTSLVDSLTGTGR